MKWCNHRIEKAKIKYLGTYKTEISKIDIKIIIYALLGVDMVK